MSVTPLTFAKFVDTTDSEQRWQIFNAIQGQTGLAENVNIIGPTDGSGNVIVNLATSIPAGTNAIGTVTANVQGGNSTAVKVDGSAVTQPVSGTVSVSGTVPVSGTFYQATQPVSVASLPSLASGTNAIGTVNPDISPATGSLSSGSNTYTVTTTNYSTLTFQAVKSGTISSGTVTIYGSVDGTTFSVLTTYVALTTGGSSTTFSATNAITAGQINTSGLKAVQFSGGSTIVGGGSLAFTVNQSATVSNVMLDNALPVGSNVIGAVNIASSQTIAVTQATASNLNATITGTVTANAGTNLSTSNLDVALSTRLKPADTLAGVTSVGSITNPLPAGSNVIGGTYSTPNVAAGTTITQATSGYSTTSGTLSAATRKYLLIQNTGTTNALYVSTDGTTPSATNGFTLAASGGGVVWEGSFVPNGAITLASTGTNYSILWA